MDVKMSHTKTKGGTIKCHTHGEHELLDSDNVGRKEKLNGIKKIAEERKRNPNIPKQNTGSYNSKEGDTEDDVYDEGDVKANGGMSIKSESDGAIGGAIEPKVGKTRSSIYERKNKTTENKKDLATSIHGDHYNSPKTRPAMVKENKPKTQSFRENPRPLPDPQERVKRAKSSCGHLTGRNAKMDGKCSSVRFQSTYDEEEDDTSFYKDENDIAKVTSKKGKANPKVTSKTAGRNQSPSITTTFTMSAPSTNDPELYKSSTGSTKATNRTRTPDSSKPKPNAIDVGNNGKTAITATSITQGGTRKEKVKTTKSSRILNIQSTTPATALPQGDEKRSQKIQQKSEKVPTTEEAARGIDTLYPIRVECCKEEIATLDVDVIVSSEDGQLQGNGMVAHHLEERGGSLFVKLKLQTLEMYEDKIVPPWEFSSSPGEGHMKCKRVFHAHVLKIQHYESQTDWHSLLGQLYLNLFTRADLMGFTSIAVPLLGTGRNGAPNSFVIDVIGEAILQFMLRPIEKRFLTIIYIVHPNHKVVTEIDIKIQEKTETLKGMKLAETEKASQKSTTNSKKPSEMKGKSGTTKNDDVCPICMDRIDVTNRKELHLCHHVFCRDCIDRCFAVSQHMCPVCKTVYGIITGNQPKGHMTEAFLKRKLPGHTSGTISISYLFNNGIQKEDHPHKGKRYKGTKRSAYLPDNLEGQKAYRLLRKAFEQRLTFTIGSSRTTGKEDVVTWNDIHHKTRMDGGPERYGYPDPGYIDRVLDELKAKGIVEE